jgi:hypothetical protein
MKRRKVRTAVLGLMAFLMWSDSMAAEEIYLHGDTNIPMILNTGGIDNDGNTGVFMDLTSISVEDLFKNGLAVKVNFFKLEKGVSTVSTAHFRMTENGGAWIAMEDGWHAVNEGAARVESEAVRLIREEMGKEECRDKYMGQITALWERKIKAAETARQEEYEKPQRETEEKNQENNKSVKSVKLPDMEMPELERAEPDKVVEIKSPGMIPEVNPVKKNASIEMPVKAEMEETEADAEKNESRKEETSAELPMTVSPEKEKTELTAVKVKGNVQMKEDAQKNEEGEITEQVEISIVSHPVVEIISKSDVT